MSESSKQGAGRRRAPPPGADTPPADRKARRASGTSTTSSAFVRDQDIRVLSLMHVGGDGWLKTLDFVPRDSAHLADVLTGGERADGSSLFGDLGIPVGASDIVMRPRLSTAFLDPFAAEPTLAVLCSHFNRQGAPLAESPDTLVRAAYRRLLARRPASNCTPSARSSSSWARGWATPRRTGPTSAATIRPRRSCSARPCAGRRSSTSRRWA